jgi:hypothetical protein
MIVLSLRRGPKQLRVPHNVFGPKLPHHPVHVIRPETTPIRKFVAKLTRAHDSRVRIARV